MKSPHGVAASRYGQRKHDDPDADVTLQSHVPPVHRHSHPSQYGSRKTPCPQSHGAYTETEQRLPSAEHAPQGSAFGSYVHRPFVPAQAGGEVFPAVQSAGASVRSEWHPNVPPSKLEGGSGPVESSV